MMRKNKVVAVCGIDGAGKTTLVESLAHWNQYKTTVFKKNYRANVDKLFLERPDEANDPFQFINTDFARSFAWALAKDFMYYYREIICDRFPVESDLILLDRWTPCVEAVAHMSGNFNEISEHIKLIPKVDAIIFVDVDATTAYNRISARGSVRPDEQLQVLSEFVNSYHSVLSLASCSVIRIKNVSMAETIKHTKEILTNIMSHRHHSSGTIYEKI